MKGHHLRNRDDYYEPTPTGDCDGCKFWSEMVAASIGCEPMKAMCLNSESHRYQKMVNSGCDKYEAGRPVDDPTR
jgi:hypothetical protein